MKKIFALILTAVILLSGCFGGFNPEPRIIGSWSTAFEAQDGAPNMLFTFAEDGTFKWYQNENDTTDNYYYGTYTVVSGEAAIRMIEQVTGNINLQTQLQNYGFSSDSSNLFFINLTQKGVVIDGVDQKYQNKDTASVPLILQLNGMGNELYGINWNTYTRYFMTKL